MERARLPAEAPTEARPPVGSETGSKTGPEGAPDDRDTVELDFEEDPPPWAGLTVSARESRGRTPGTPEPLRSPRTAEKATTDPPEAFAATLAAAGPPPPPRRDGSPKPPGGPSRLPPRPPREAPAVPGPATEVTGPPVRLKAALEMEVASAQRSRNLPGADTERTGPPSRMSVPTETASPPGPPPRLSLESPGSPPSRLSFESPGGPPSRMSVELDTTARGAPPARTRSALADAGPAVPLGRVLARGTDGPEVPKGRVLSESEVEASSVLATLSRPLATLAIGGGLGLLDVVWRQRDGASYVDLPIRPGVLAQGLLVLGIVWALGALVWRRFGSSGD